MATADPAAKAAVARDPALVRAIALQRIDRAGWAGREWRDALSRFDARQRRLAIEVAQDNGWVNRGVFGLEIADHPEEKRWYRSEEHTSELQSLMRISYAVFCLKKKKTHTTTSALQG